MPLTDFQKRVAGMLAKNRTPDSHLAGGAALHFSPNSRRWSNDLDYFHDSVERTAEAFAADRLELEGNGLTVAVEVSQPGYVRAIIREETEETKIEWAHDSAWRFMPAVRVPQAGFVLHPTDLAVNKILALAGRDEARDYLDALFADEKILPLGALVWAAAGKDPGFTPLSLLELLKRRGRHRPEEFSRLRMSKPVDAPALKTQWLSALTGAEDFIRSRPSSEIGCLYYSAQKKKFVAPDPATPEAVPHFGSPGGILPRFYAGDSLTG